MLEPSAAGDDDAGAQASQAAPGGELVLELAPGAPQLAVQIASDLHIEFAERFVPAHPDDAALQSIVTPSAPVLALLGDIGIPTYPVYRRFLLLQAERFEHVLVITGNHEYYDTKPNGVPPPARQPGQSLAEFSLQQGKKTSVEDMRVAIAAICAEHPRLYYVDNRVVRLGAGAGAPTLLCSALWSAIPPEAVESVHSVLTDYMMAYTRCAAAEEAAEEAAVGGSGGGSGGAGVGGASKQQGKGKGTAEGRGKGKGKPPPLPPPLPSSGNCGAAAGPKRWGVVEAAPVVKSTKFAITKRFGCTHCAAACACLRRLTPADTARCVGEPRHMPVALQLAVDSWRSVGSRSTPSRLGGSSPSWPG